MSFRIRWHLEGEGGAFPLSSQPLLLCLQEGLLDRVSDLPEGVDGLRVQPPDADGRLDLEAYGGLTFFSGEREFRRVRLPVGGRVSFFLGDQEGTLQAEGEAPASDPLIGTELNGHKILGRLGAGAVGVVYRALQINLDREVALKMLDPEIAADPAKVESFHREARAAGKLSHPHLVQVHDVGEADGHFYYTMELVPGGNYEQRIRDHGPLAWREALRVTRDCARALAYAQEHHLVHRDVKPENLMVGNGDVAKLADLGLAATRGMVDHDAAGGTPHFMAPETVGGGQVDSRSDLYSLGCTLFRLLTGHTVFEGDNLREILRAHRDAPPPTLREMGIKVPREVEELLAALLAKDPEDRPESAELIAEECEQLLLTAGRGGGRRLLVVGLLAVVAGTVWLLTRPDPESPPLDPGPEVVDPDPSEANAAAQAELAKQREQTAYYQALAEKEGEARKQALETFLEKYPQSSFASEALQEIRRQEAVIAAATQPTVDPQVEAQQQRLADELGAVQTLLDQERFGAALERSRQGEFGTDPAMDRLREQIDQAVASAHATWAKQHQEQLDAQDWSGARALREGIVDSLGQNAPAHWTVPLELLQQQATEAQAAAAEARFRSQRQAFLAAAGTPVRSAVRTFRFAEASVAWQQAVQTCTHAALAAAAATEQASFDRAATTWQSMVEQLTGAGLDIEEAREGRKAEVLALTPDGLRLRVQIRGERQERTDPWELYRQPSILSSLFRSLAADHPEWHSGLAECWRLVALEDLASRLDSWQGIPATAALGEFRSTVVAWRDLAPWPEAWSITDLDLLQYSVDLVDALEAGNDLLALGRVEDLQAEFSLYAVWLSGGEATWGMKP